MTPLELVLSRFPNAKKTGGNQWADRCPAHDDRRASLSIGVGDNGLPVLHCHAGCPVESVVAARGLTMADMMGDNNNGTPRKAPPSPPPKKPPKPPPQVYATAEAALLAYKLGQPATVWTYDSAAGDPVGAVGRWNPPEGKMILPVHFVNGGWQRGGMPEPRPIYALPVIRETDGVVYVLEGEKCADAALSLELVATTSAHGAGSAAKTDWSPLAGRSVAVLPDCDEAGMKYAHEVARLLGELSPPAVVRIVRLPGLPDKGDFVDFVAARPGVPPEKIREELEALVAAAPVVEAPAEPATAPTSGPVVVSLCDVEARPVDWLWPGRVPLGRLTLLVGRPGCGKSFLTLDAAARVTTGSPWPDGTACPKGDVILISAEDDPADTIRPRLDAHHGDARRVHLLRAVTEYNPKSKAPVETCFTLADVAALELTIQRFPETKLIIVDPIGSYLGGKTDAHRDNEVRGVLAPVALLAERYGVAVVLVAHRRKSTGTVADDLALGSRGFTGIARSVLHLTADTNNKTRRLLLPGKSNLSAPADGLAFTITGEPARLWWERDPVKLDADEALAHENAAEHSGRDPEARREAADWLRLALADGPRLAKELIEEAQEEHGIAKRTLDRARRELGVVAYRQERQGPWSWRLPAGVTGCQSQVANAPKIKDCGNVAICNFGPENAVFDGESGVQNHRLPDCHNSGEPGGLFPNAPPFSWAMTAVERAEQYRRERAAHDHEEVTP